MKQDQSSMHRFFIVHPGVLQHRINCYSGKFLKLSFIVKDILSPPTFVINFDLQVYGNHDFYGIYN